MARIQIWIYVNEIELSSSLECDLDFIVPSRVRSLSGRVSIKLTSLLEWYLELTVPRSLVHLE
jgi:hypothetical protein